MATAATKEAPKSDIGAAHFIEKTIRVQDTTPIYVRIYNDGTRGGTPLLMLCGLSRNHRDYEDLTAYLHTMADYDGPIILMDYRGRGNSGRASWKTYNLANELADILDVMTALNVEHANILGTSRGGLIAMMIGASRPGFLRKVILNDVGPRVESQGLMRIKSLLSKPPRVSDTQAAIATLQAYMSTTFPDLADDDWAELVRRIFIEQKPGSFVMDFDPKLAKTLAGLTAETPPVEIWPLFETLRHVPLLCLRGEHSDILSEETVAKMRRHHPNFSMMTVNGQGHAPLLRGQQELKRIATFLQD